MKLWQLKENCSDCMVADLCEKPYGLCKNETIKRMTEEEYIEEAEKIKKLDRHRKYSNIAIEIMVSNSELRYKR